MKKAALTFGLFSLIMVATSFATPEKTNKSIAGIIDIGIGADGNQTGDQGRKKHDLSMSNQSNVTYNQSKSSSIDIQSIGANKKID